MNAADFDFVLSPPGSALLRAGMSYDSQDPLVMTERLRRLAPDATPGQVAAAAAQVSLRRRARAKFGDLADSLYLTAEGLEQATHPRVASARARQAREMGAGSALDLGCGIGSDLIALAEQGFAVVGVDRDELTARVARANLRVFDLAGEVRCADAQQVDTSTFDLVFLDPARRRGSARVFDPSAFSPPWGFVAGLLVSAAQTGHQRVMVKLGPGLDHALIPPGVTAEWVSLDGDLKEVCLWAPAPGPARRRATLLRSATEARCSVAETDSAEDVAVGDVGGFVYEPDPAVIRAHLVSAVAQRVGGWLLDPHLAYVSSDRDVPSPLARRFRVLDVLPFKEKALRQALRHRNIGAITIKKRGVSVTPEELRRRLALRGDEPATLILTRTPGSARALLVEPLD